MGHYPAGTDPAAALAEVAREFFERVDGSNALDRTGHLPGGSDMTLPLTLEQTRAVVEALQRDGHAWLSVGAVCPHGKHRPDDHLCRIAGQVAPPDWVEAAAAVCERCGGDLAERLQARDWGAVQVVQNCDDCHNGKPIHTLSVPCDHIINGFEDEGWYCGCGDGLSDDEHRQHGACATCLMFNDSEPCEGTVTGRYVVAALVPYEACVEAFAEIWDNMEKLLRDNVLTSIPAVIGSPQPGDWVAHLEVVT